MTATYGQTWHPDRPEDAGSAEEDDDRPLAALFAHFDDLKRRVNRHLYSSGEEPEDPEVPPAEARPRNVG
ncbi:hypothetical protein ACFWY9_30160 [Amycolatopsis sp. NPDC059027]|uniref:hypothetical protein n=1 Tax=unclassified Amycolatopsis TaxID=2618356 RepID=UPI00366FED03